MGDVQETTSATPTLQCYAAVTQLAGTTERARATVQGSAYTESTNSGHQACGQSRPGTGVASSTMERKTVPTGRCHYD